MNALVFGLVGALAGGALGLLTYDDGKIPKAETSLHTQEQMQFKSSKLYLVPNPQELPEFVRQRLQPSIVEELIEPDSVTDDGTLHEPHKAYRIQKNAELFSDPQASASQSKESQ